MNVYQVWIGDNPPSEIEYNRKWCAENGHSYNLLTPALDKSYVRVEWQSDSVRWRIACEDPNALILCADAAIVSEPVTVAGLPSFLKHRNGNNCCGGVLVNRCCELFRKGIETAKVRGYDWQSCCASGKLIRDLNAGDLTPYIIHDHNQTRS